MQKAFLLLCWFALFSSAQAQTKKYKNSINFQLMQSTPSVGILYKRVIFEHKTKPLIVETGVGMGWLPAGWYDSPTSKPISASHDISVTYGKRFTKLTIGYSGIIAPSDRFLKARNCYLPTPHLGVFLGERDKFYLTIQGSGSIYNKQVQRFGSDNTLLTMVQTRLSTYLGIGFGSCF